MAKELKPTWTDLINYMLKNNQANTPAEAYEIIDEIQYQVNDWKDGESYYPKPEDILVDYIFCSPSEAHAFLSLFYDQ